MGFGVFSFILMFFFTMIFPILLLIFLLPKIYAKNAKQSENKAGQVFGAENVSIDDLGKSIFGFSLEKVLIIKSGTFVFRVIQHLGSKNNPPHTTFFIEEDVGLPFTLTKEGFVERIGKKISLMSELELGRKDLDDYFFIAVSDATRGKDFFFQSKMTEVLQRLMKLADFEKMAAIKREVGKNNKLSDYFPFSTSSVITLRLYGSLDRHDPEVLKEAASLLSLCAEVLRRFR
ncbi:MAG TPA: hypothetical protein PKA63_00940 [Oligoflexia bacterium]|nr:hypothetical protein [Oligoflexia bacterium]HMP47215.1 hypothetical protein [Oligoflexia bacterium]